MELMLCAILFSGLGLLGGVVLGGWLMDADWLARAKTGFWKHHRGKLYKVTDVTGKDPYDSWRMM